MTDPMLYIDGNGITGEVLRDRWKCNHQKRNWLDVAELNVSDVIEDLPGDTRDCFIVSVDTLAVVLTLPTLADNQGRTIYFKIIDVSAGSLTIDGEGAELVEGVASVALTILNSHIILVAGSTQWSVF